MIRMIGSLLMVLAGGMLSAADRVEVDQVQGNWLGTWEGKGTAGGKTVAEIYGLGNGNYQATFTAYDSGEQDSGVFTFAILGSSVSDTRVEFQQKIDLGLLGMFQFDAAIEDGKLNGKYSNGNRFQGALELKRIVKEVPEVGAAPLPGAVVLFDGKSLDQWRVPAEEVAAWKIVDGALVSPDSPPTDRSQPGHLAALPLFEDAQIHLEFRTPYLPEKRGAERGTGGVWLAGKHQLQIVDSYGFPREKDGTGEFVDTQSLGAIWKRHAARETAALPPGEWQAFDITYRAEKRNLDGSVQQPAEITVQLNGQLIHDRVTLADPTEDAPALTSDLPMSLVLRNSGQPVAYRNIWYLSSDTAAGK